MARMVQCGFASIAFLEVIGVIVCNDVPHSKRRAYFFFNENKPLSSAFEQKLLARFELAHRQDHDDHHWTSATANPTPMARARAMSAHLRVTGWMV